MFYPSSLTLGKLKASSLAEVAGVNPESSVFLQKVNEGVERLMARGNFWNTVVKGRLYSTGNVLVWPRYVGDVLALKVCGRLVRLSNHWYEFLPLVDSDVCPLGRSSVLVDDGVIPVFKNIPTDTTATIRVALRSALDVDKEITFYGVDANGNDIEETVVIADPTADTFAAFARVDRVRKDVTSGVLDVYQVDSVTGVATAMATYDPSEEEPRYRYTHLRNIPANDCERTFDFLARLQFVPVALDTDIVQIDCISAIKFMFMAQKNEEAQDFKNAAICELKAIKELNMQVETRLPRSKIPVDVNPFGTSSPAMASIGRIQ